MSSEQTTSIDVDELLAAVKTIIKTQHIYFEYTRPHSVPSQSYFKKVLETSMRDINNKKNED